MRKRIKKLFFDASQITPKQLKISQLFFMLEAAIAGPLINIVGGVYLASLCKYLGASEAVSGIVISASTIMGFLQLISPIIAEKYKRRKLIVFSAVAASRALMVFIFLIPLLIPSHTVGLVLAALCFAVAHASNHFLSPMFSIWITDVVPPDIRGKYFGVKDAITSLSVAAFFYIAGTVLDAFKKNNNEAVGFFVVGIILLVLALVNLAAYLPIREPVKARKPFKLKLKDVFTVPFKHKQFRKVLFLTTFWSVSFQMANPFFAVYQVSRLEMSYSFISIVAVVNVVLRVFFAPIWGRIANRYSWFVATGFSMLFIGVSMALHFFLIKANVGWLMWVITLVSSIGWAGIGLGLFGLQFEFAPSEGKTMYVACNNAMAGILGFVASLLGAAFVGASKGFAIHLGFFIISDMQILFLFAGSLVIGCALYITGLEKKRRIAQINGMAKSV